MYNYVYATTRLHLEFWPEYEIRDRTTDQGLPYDYRSIMHYRPSGCSNNRKPVFYPLHVPMDAIRSTLTEPPTYLDYLHINLLYCEGALISSCMRYQ